MKNIFLAFIFIVLSFMAHSVFSQDAPLPQCEPLNRLGCVIPSQLSLLNCSGDLMRVVGAYECSSSTLVSVSCGGNCSCPDGYKLNTVMTPSGLSTSCVEDVPGEPGDCEYGADANGVCYPEDCPFGDGTPEACSNNSSSSSSSSEPPICVPPYYNDPVTGECVTEPDSSSSSSVSSEGGGGSSSGTGSSAGDSGNSSSSGAGDGDGDGDGDGGSGSSAGSGGGGGGGGSGSSAGAGECDPSSKDYAACIGQVEEADDSKSQEIIGDFETKSLAVLDDLHAARLDDISSSAIDSDFENAPSALSSALKQFLPNDAACTPIEITFLGSSRSISCGFFEDFKFIFGWFLTCLAAVHIWQFSTAPVNR